MFRDIFDPTGEYCRRLKKDCNAHYCWEKLKRGELDMERVRCWMKLDELMEKERQEKDSISRRAGVLSLMLHSTFNHEVMEKVIKMQKSGGGGDPASPPAQIASSCRSRSALDVLCCWHLGVTFKGVNEISR